jgi:hypothetical protein
VAVFPGRFPVPSCTPLDAIAMGCPVVVAADGFSGSLAVGTYGFVYAADSNGMLATTVLEAMHSAGVRDRSRRQARETAATYSFASLAEDHLEIYGRLLKKTPTINRSVHPIGYVDGGGPMTTADPVAANWISRTTLALDLDGTLVTPWHGGGRPTAFPLQSSDRITLDCENGKAYLVRAGLAQLASILDLPWHSRIVWSTASQDKVDEASRKVVVGGATLAERTEACVGAELLHLFAANRRITLPAYSSQSVANLRGRNVVAKPSQFLFVNTLLEIGSALRSGKRALAFEIAATSSLREGYGLMIDDNPFFAPDLSSVYCHRVLPFTAPEKFRALFSQLDMPSVRQFELLDHAWRTSSSPFGYLRRVLTHLSDWTAVTRELNVEMQLLEMSLGTNSLRDFFWLRDRSLANATYGRYRGSGGRKRTNAERSRIREHVKLYRLFTTQIVLEDLRRNWSVLMLGRDMDYAFEFLKTLHPETVESGKVALLPLSRLSIKTSTPQVIAKLILDSLPGLRTRSANGLKIYDTGFHGHVPQFIKNSLNPHLSGKEIRAHFFNACGCDKSALGCCTGSQLVFRDARGRFSVDRTLGLSIERCPHTTGTLRRVIVDAGRFVFEHAAVSDKERERAESLLAFVRKLAARPVLRDEKGASDTNPREFLSDS